MTTGLYPRPTELAGLEEQKGTMVQRPEPWYTEQDPPLQVQYPTGYSPAGTGAGAGNAARKRPARKSQALRQKNPGNLIIIIPLSGAENVECPSGWKGQNTAFV
jgi:hypothetical protein